MSEIDVDLVNRRLAEIKQLIDELGESSNYQGNARNLRKIISRAEDDGILNTFIHKLSNRKYVHLTRKAHEYLSIQPWNFRRENRCRGRRRSGPT